MAISGLADNQMVTEGVAAGAGFPLRSGESHGSGGKCMTKLAATTRYNLQANFGSYADNQLVPASLWAAGGDITPPSYLNAEVHRISETNTSINIGWSGWTDNVGIDHYVVKAINYTTQITEKTSANIPSNVLEYNTTGLTQGTAYEMLNIAFDAAGNQVALLINISTTSAPAYYSFQANTTVTDLDSSAPCAYAFNATYYANVSQCVVGTVLYTNTTLTTPISGTSTRWRKFRNGNGVVSSIRTSNGSILEFVAC
jgi:hypothetical protein